jgi:hypothetical protein
MLTLEKHSLMPPDSRRAAHLIHYLWRCNFYGDAISPACPGRLARVRTCGEITGVAAFLCFILKNES